MKGWNWKWIRVGRRRGDPPTVTVEDEPGTPSPAPLEPGVVPELLRDETDNLAQLCRDMHQLRVHLEVDDGVTVPVGLSDQNAGVVLEATQRLREHRERERTRVPPVRDFGERWPPEPDW